MVTTESPSPSPERSEENVQQVVQEKGFLGQLVGSILEVRQSKPFMAIANLSPEPTRLLSLASGNSNQLISAMNASFFGLILVLFAMAVLSSWNKHVIFLLIVSSLLWATMVW